MPNDKTNGVSAPDLLQDPSRHGYLSDEDVETIREGLRLIADKLRATRPCDLPNAVLFTETSARPFAYALKPVLEKLYAAKGRPAPKLLFILTQHGGGVEDEILKPGFSWDQAVLRLTKWKMDRTAANIEMFERLIRAGDLSDGYDGESVEDYRARLGRELAKCRQNLEEAPSEMGHRHQAWKLMVARLREVADALSADGNRPYLLIVDEFVNHGDTLHMLEAAYREAKRSTSGLRVRYFVFRDAGYGPKFRHRLGPRYAFADRSHRWFEYGEVGWRGDGGCSRPPDSKASCVGVAKSLDRDAVFRAPQRDLAKMRFLRRLLRQLGEEAASCF